MADKTPTDSHALPLIGRDKLVTQVLDRLQRPDDVRNSRPKDFIVPGFFGLAGIGKSRLLREIEQRAQKLTPYIVSIDFDPRAGGAHPGTRLEFARYLTDILDTQDKPFASFFQKRNWSKDSPFVPVRRAIGEIEFLNINQTINLKESVASGITQVVDVDKTLFSKLGDTFSDALLHLHHKSETRQEFGKVGKERPPARPLILILLDSVELAPQPVREWLPQLPNFFGGKNKHGFYAMLVAAGREERAGLLETPLPPLDAKDGAAFVRVYVSRQRATDWASRSTGLPLLSDTLLLQHVVTAGQGIPLLLQLLADAAALDPASFVPLAEELPADHEARVNYVLRRYLRRLSEQAEAQHDQELWQSYRLLLYGAVPRRIMGVGLLRALLQGLPGTDFDSRTNYDALYERLGREAFVERTANAELLMHKVVREGALDFMQASDPEQMKRLNQRAAAWFETQGNAIEHFYHAVQFDYTGTIEALKANIVDALDAGEWATAQQLMDTTSNVKLTPEDEAWLTLFKADLAWGEKNRERALERLRNLYGEGVPPKVRAQVAQRLEKWGELNAELEEQIRQTHSIKLKNISNVDLYWWAVYRELPHLQAAALRGLGEAARLQDRYSDAIGYYQRALALWEAIEDRSGQASALLGLGEAARAQDRYSEAIGYFQRALALWEALEDRYGQASALRGLGAAALAQDRYSEAIGYYQRALALWEALEDRSGQAYALRGLGTAARAQSRYGEAIGYDQRALALWEAIEDRYGQAAALLGLGEAARLQDRYSEAIGYDQRALALWEALEDRYGQASALRGLGEAARLQDRYGDAIGYDQRALALWEAIEDRYGQASALRGLGEAARAQNRYGEAIGYDQRALALWEAIEDRYGQASALRGLGEAARAQDRYSEAIGYDQRALALFEAIEDRSGQASALRGLGAAALAQNRYGEAIGYDERALALCEAIEDRYGQASALVELGTAARAQDRYGEATSYFDAALGLFGAIGLPFEVVRYSIIEGNALCDQCESHRQQGQAQLAAQALACACHLYRWGERFAPQLPQMEQTNTFITALAAFNQRLVRNGGCSGVE